MRRTPDRTTNDDALGGAFRPLRVEVMKLLPFFVREVRPTSGLEGALGEAKKLVRLIVCSGSVDVLRLELVRDTEATDEFFLLRALLLLLSVRTSSVCSMYRLRSN